MEHQNLKFLQDTFFHTQQICSWIITTDMQLLYSNCPEQDFFYNLFLISSCRKAVETHFTDFHLPLIVSDRTGFVWIAVSGPSEANKISLLYLLGPVFTSEIIETHVRQICRKLHLTPETTERLWKFVGNVPTISPNTASCYAGMLHYCVNGKPAPSEDIKIQNEHFDHAEEVAWGEVGWHGTWITEQRIFKSIMDGRLVDFAKIATGNIGNIGGGDPIRQAKNEIIVFSVLCSRAAILGGVSSEGALSLSDYFIQLVEAAETVPEITNIGAEMQQAFVDRVQKAKASSGFSTLVRACKEYVETHILEKISLRDMALEVGYNEQYISRKFKSETGESLIDYINGQKVELSKAVLREGKLSVAEIGDRLAFSSPSYFSSVFKKKMGIGPAEYQQIHKEGKT